MERYASYIITGLTASGKTDFAHSLAKKIGGTIINCDSVQIYRGVENISASPFANGNVSDGTIEGIPYRLFSILPLNRQINVADYLFLARKEYNAAVSAGRVPIFVGGTGYYINALVNGISPIPKISAENRKKAREFVKQDIISAKKLLPKNFKTVDQQRIARALEVFFETGEHLIKWQKQPRRGAIVPTPYKILIKVEPKILHQRIIMRISKMFESGALDEAREVLKFGWDENRAIGLPQLCSFLRGKITKEKCIHDWTVKTNQYAKRQRTWFRTQFTPDIELKDMTGKKLF